MLRQQSSELKDELARVTKELESNLVMTETVTWLTQVELKRVGRGGKWQPWVIQYICELLVIGTPPASIPSIISSSYQMYYGKEPDEVPQVSFVRHCRVIVQATWVFIHELTWHRNFKSYDENPDIDIDANDEPLRFLSRIEAILSISAVLEPPA